MRSTRYLHAIGCGCRTCLPARPIGRVANAALTGAAHVLRWAADLMVMMSPPAHDCPKDAPGCGQTWLCYSCQSAAKQ